MTAPTDPIPLAADFPPASAEQWRELVAGVLRKSGAPADVDPEAKLTRTTYDGIAVKPLYTASDAPAAAATLVRGTAREGWDVRALLVDSEPARANASALRDLANGVTSLWLKIGRSGVALESLAATLDGVFLDMAPCCSSSRPTRPG
jgi:methylmalonyl-CoA mutase